MKDFIKWFDEFYNELKEKYSVKEFKYIFLTNYVFEIVTYDDDISLEFGKTIYEVMKVIKDRNNFEYIKDENNYKKYIIVCNILNEYDLINWGSSIRGAWFNDDSVMTFDVSCKEFNGKIIYENPSISIDELLKWIEE